MPLVLIGMRKGSDGRWWLLLQKWWPHMQLVELSQQYFASSKASICFVVRPQVGIPVKFERCDRDYAEAQMAGNEFLNVGAINKYRAAGLCTRKCQSTSEWV